jgi:hypothetical protein
MPGLVPGIHVFGCRKKEDVDGRDAPGHDGARKIFTSPVGPVLARSS